MTDSATSHCTVTINHGERVLKCRRGMTLFAALRTNHILLPTGCGARGQCGQCTVTLVDGEASLFTDNEVRRIPEQERAQGKRLACQMRLNGDVEVIIPDFVFGAAEHPVVLDAVTSLTYDIKRFSFTLADGEAVPHKAGQYITLVARIAEPKSQPMRCFSFANGSATTDRIDIIVRKNPKGVLTPYLFDHAASGDEFKVIAPYGDFFLRDGPAPCVWIGGGSGLSPFLGMLEDMIARKTVRPVHLFFGAVTPEDLYYVDLLRDIASNNNWFTFTPALSGEKRCPECEEYGLVTDVVAKHITNAKGHEAYLCGGPGMIGACLKLLTELGIDRDKIYYDRF